MSEQPKPLSDDELSQVVGGAASAPGAGAGVSGGISTIGGQMPEDIYGLLALAQSAANEMRNAARESRSIDMASQVSDMKSIADGIVEAGKAGMSDAITAGAMQIVNGALQSGMGSMAGVNHGLSSIRGSIGAGEQLPNVQQATDTFDKLVANAPPSFADIAGAAKVDVGAHVNDQMQQMMDVVKDVREKLSAIEQSQADAFRNIIKKS